MTPTDAVRTVIVDDSADVRVLLRILLEQDDRFEVVGEAANGAEGADLCGRIRPDLVVLDRQMPVMGGLEAIPLIRARSPQSEIVLYTAAADSTTEEAAAAAGALGVLHKAGVAADVAQDLAALLARRRPEEDGGPAPVEVRVGPVSSAAARVWVANTRQILDAVERQPDAIGGPVDASVLAIFRRFLDAWEAVASDTDVFFWTGRADPDDVHRVVEQWARIDAMDQATLDALGCRWAPPEARPFFAALTAAVLDAVSGQEHTRRLAEQIAAETPEDGEPEI